MKKFLILFTFLASLSMGAQVTSTQLKATIDANITNRTAANKITPAIHGATEKAIVDFITQVITTVESRTVNGHALTANVTVTKSDVGLANADNTSDANKPISTATQTALDNKQAVLISGTNIKTVAGQSLLGTGDIDGRPYKVYTAVISQDGTDAPVAESVLENTLGGEVTFTYSSVGNYAAVLPISAPFQKGAFLTLRYSSVNHRISSVASTGTNFFFSSSNSSGNAADNLISYDLIEIRVYN